METQKIVEIKERLLEKANNMTEEPAETYRRFWQIHRFTENNKVIVFLFLNKEGDTNFQLFFQRREITNKLLFVMNEYGKKINKSVHFSSACFCRYSRRAENAYSISSITIDLDYYDTKYKDCDINEIIWNEKFQKVLTKFNLTLNYVIDSGNGAYLVFLLKNPVALQTNSSIGYLYLEVYREIVKELKQFGADNKVVDVARVFKLENTHNYKTNKCVNIRYENYNDKNDFAILLDTLIKTNYSKRKNELHCFKHDGTFASNPKPLKHKERGYERYNEHRLQDFKMLIEVRDGDIKYRNNFLFIVALQLCYMKYSYDRILEQCLNFNQHFVDPYPRKEVERIVSYVKDILDLPQYNHDDGVYHCYRTETIIEVLDITEDEMKHLKVLISKKIKKKRRNKRTNEYRRKKKIGKKILDNAYERKICSSNSLLEIETKLNVSKATAYRKMHKNNMITPKNASIEKENLIIIHMKNQNKSNPEIANELNMNINTLKTRIKKLKRTGRL